MEAGAEGKNNPMHPRAFVAGGEMPPLFFEGLRRGDLETILEQVAERKFDERILFGVAARCPLGAPSVILCRPLFRGRPFPTTFWLTCPHVIQQCDALEAEGGVRELESFLAQKPLEWRNYGVLHSAIRMRFVKPAVRRFLSARRKRMWDSLRKGRVGGTREASRIRVKCLHLQAASWLALGHHPGEKWLESRISKLCSSDNEYPCSKRESQGQ